MGVKIEDTREYRAGFIDGTIFTKKLVETILDTKIDDEQKLKIIKVGLEVVEELPNIQNK